MEWHLDKTQLVESTQTSLVVKSGHFQISNWLKACHPQALTQLSPNLEEYAAEAEWTAWVLSAVNAQLMECASHGSFQPAPWPFACQHTAPEDSWLLLPLLLRAALNSTQSRSQTCTCRARKQTGHSLQLVLCQLAQAHLSTGHSLNTFKKHIPRQNTWNANPLYTTWIWSLFPKDSHT